MINYLKKKERTLIDLFAETDCGSRQQGFPVALNRLVLSHRRLNRRWGSTFYFIEIARSTLLN